jgi:hypothetical protein
VRLSHHGGRRALPVEPGDRLRPGRTIEVILLEGILDIERLPLQPHQPYLRVPGSVDVLR